MHELKTKPKPHNVNIADAPYTGPWQDYTETGFVAVTPPLFVL